MTGCTPQEAPFKASADWFHNTQDPVDPTTFWVNPFGVAFKLIRASDLIQVDHHGKVIDGGPVRLLNTAAFMIHSASRSLALSTHLHPLTCPAVHEARPDVMCAAHSHSIYGRTFCSLGRKLDVITQDSCAFHNVSQPLSFIDCRGSCN